jgi:hypothetical protein
MFDKPVKAMIYLFLGAATVWILGGIVPKMINILDPSEEKTLLTAVYWIVLFAIFAIPQYITWYTELDLKITTPMIAVATMAGTTLAIVGLTVIKIRLLNTITLSDFSNTAFFFVYWMAMVLMLFVPQYLVYTKVEQSN